MSIPATEKQIKYAKDLGIKFPTDITLEEMSQPLDRHLSKDTSAPQWLIQYMTGLGLDATKYIGSPFKVGFHKVGLLQVGFTKVSLF